MFEVLAFYQSGQFARRAVFATLNAANTAAAWFRRDGFVVEVRRAGGAR